MAACSPAESGEETVGVSQAAIEGVDCGYTVTTRITKGHNKKHFHARVKVTRTGGGRLKSTGFTVLLDTGGAELLRVGHGKFEKVENGYLLSTVDRHESRHDCDDDDDDRNDPDVLAGRAYRFYLTLKAPRTNLESHIISSSGVTCDQTGPAVTLTASGDLFTSNGTLALSATANDNVKVSKVVFSRDGVAIGTDTTAPYTFDEAVTSALNGRHRYTATAYDL
ncbi:MAG TPA: Ig-like domain-containing protein, partial [Polyangiaceae bacterium]